MPRALDLPSALDYRRVQTEVGRLILRGLGRARIANELQIDEETAAKYMRKFRAACAADVEDPQGLRGLLARMAWDMYGRVCDGLEDKELSLKTKPAYYREARGFIQAILDVTGLRQLHIDHGSSQFAGLLAGLVQLQAGPVVEGDCKVIEET